MLVSVFINVTKIARDKQTGRHIKVDLLTLQRKFQSISGRKNYEVESNIREGKIKMSIMAGLLTITSTTVITSLIESFLPIVMAIITGRDKEKDEVKFDLVMECFEETQKRFAENYNEIYTIDDIGLFSQMLKIYASEGKKGQKVEQIIAGIIESSFEVDATDTMIDVWKTCFDKTISDKKYKSLLSLIGCSNGSFKGKDYFYKNVNIFLSYSWKDEKKADEIDAFFSGIGIGLTRDKRSIEQWGSIRVFMNSIKYSDYAILIISDAYLKSINCMYEIAQLGPV